MWKGRLSRLEWAFVTSVISLSRAEPPFQYLLGHCNGSNLTNVRIEAEVPRIIYAFTKHISRGIFIARTLESVLFLEMYLFILERKRAGGGAEREGERETVPGGLPTKHKPSPGSIPLPSDHDPSQNQESDA